MKPDRRRHEDPPALDCWSRIAAKHSLRDAHGDSVTLTKFGLRLHVPRRKSRARHNGLRRLLVNPPNKVPVLQDHSPGSDAGQQRKSKDGEKTIVVPSDATGGNLIPGDKAD